MLSLFCLRLAAGLTGSLLILSPRHINPRFYRTHFLIVFGLTVAASSFLMDRQRAGLSACLGAALGIAFLGSVVWSLHRAPGGLWLIVAGTVCLVAGVLQAENPQNASAPHYSEQAPWLLAGGLASGALLGLATTAMLMGHSYLIAPSMSLSPLFRLLRALAVAIVLRGVVAGVSLWSWTNGHPLSNLKEVAVFWLPLRWAMSFVGPLVLSWMAYQATKIRSTQSATGILYVVVIFCFLGELTGQLLANETGFSL
jgi:hypothetical protein